MNKISKELYKHWIHHHEEDTNDVNIFRPEDFKFEPSHGRIGFVIKENGQFIQEDIGIGDGIERRNGKWKMEGENKLIINLEGESKPRILNILSYNKDMLKIKKIF